MDYLNNVISNSNILYMYLVTVLGTILLISSPFVLSKIIIICLGLLICYMLYNHDYETRYKQVLESSSFDKSVIKDGKTKNIEMLYHNIYPLHHSPNKIKYIPMIDSLVGIFKKLDFLKTFEPAIYEELIYLTEYFLKTHFKILRYGKKSEQSLQKFQILQDVRKQLLNKFTEVYMNIPDRFQNTANECRLKIEGLTYNRLKMVARKCGVSYKPPYSFDSTQKEYDLF